MTRLPKVTTLSLDEIGNCGSKKNPSFMQPVTPKQV